MSSLQQPGSMHTEDLFPILFRVCESLCNNGFEQQAHEFLDRVMISSSFDEVARLAREYLEMRWVGH